MPLVVVVEASALVPNVFHVSWSSPESAAAWVEVDLEGVPKKTPPSVGTEHDIAVLGLASGRSYQARAVDDVDGVQRESDPFTLLVPPLPPSVPAIEVTTRSAHSFVATGYVLSAWLDLATGDTTVGIIDGEGQWVWHRVVPAGNLVVSPSFSPHRAEILWDEYINTGRLGKVQSLAHRTRLDGTDDVTTELEQGHHAVVEPEPGVLAWLAADIRPGGSDADWVMSDRILEQADGSSAPTEVISLYDDWLGGEFDYPCAHTTTPLALFGYAGILEWTHTNSLVFLPDDDAFVINTRWTDAVLKVRRSTGEILWQLGGEGSDFTFPGGDPLYEGAEASHLWSHSHLSQVWDGGFVAFDNGPHADPQVSSVVEVAYDEGAGTAWEVFRYTDPQHRFMGILGDVRKLPGGTYLISWSTGGGLTEVAPDGTVLWEAVARPSAAPARIAWVPDLYAVGAP